MTGHRLRTDCLEFRRKLSRETTEHLLSRRYEKTNLKELAFKELAFKELAIHGYSDPWLFRSMAISIHGYSDPCLIIPIHVYSDPWLFRSMFIPIHVYSDPWLSPILIFCPRNPKSYFLGKSKKTRAGKWSRSVFSKVNFEPYDAIWCQFGSQFSSPKTTNLS